MILSPRRLYYCEKLWNYGIIKHSPYTQMLRGLVGMKWINRKTGSGSLGSLVMRYVETQSMYIRNRELWKTSQRNKEWTPQRWINHNCLITSIWRWMSNHLGARNSFAFHPTKRTKHIAIQTCSAGVRQWPPGTWSCQPGTNNSCFSLRAVPKAVMQYFSLLLLPTWNVSHPFQHTNIVHTSPC